MKTTIRTTLLCLAAAISLALQPLRAASDAAREFDQLTLDRDKALAAAAEPINHLYKTALEALMRRATQASDLDTALRIRKAIEEISAQAEMAAAAAKVVGAWNFFNHADEHKATVELNADTTYTEGGKRIGVWKIQGRQLIISLDNRDGLQDRYDLPGEDGKLEGANTLGQGLTITRKAE